MAIYWSFISIVKRINACIHSYFRIRAISEITHPRLSLPQKEDTTYRRLRAL